MDNLKNSSTKLAGASIVLSPMSDNFVEIILDTLDGVDTSKVWTETDDVSTTVRGKSIHVFNVTKAICVEAAKTGEHISFQATYAMGGPPPEGEVKDYLKEDDSVNNIIDRKADNAFVAAKFALYPLSEGDYVETIFKQIDAIKAYVEVSKTYYSTKLTGGIVDIFNGLENVFTSTVDAGSNHTHMTVSVSINSPSHT